MNIPLNRDFIRGVFDGDGSIWLANKQYSHGGYSSVAIFTASEKFASQLEEILTKFGVRLTCNNNIYKLAISTIEGVKLFYEYLYVDATIFLKRKEKKYRLNLRET